MRVHTILALILTVCSAADVVAQQRRAFEIAVGPVSGDLYIQGERLAAVVSHPPGLSRCADPALCGPPGVIATARATATLSEGLLAIARGEIASAFSPADVAIAMRLNVGKGKQNQSRLRAIGVIGEETLYVVAAGKGPVKNIRGLRGRWIGIGAPNSRTRVAATALLAAARLKADAVKVSDATGAAAAELLKQRKLDAFIWIGTRLPNEISAMLGSGAARLVPLEAPVLDRLASARLGYTAKPIKVGQTVSVPVIWLADEKQPADLVFGVVRAAFNAKNAASLSPADNDPSSLKLSRLPADFAVPLHPGAAQFFVANVRPSN